MTHKCTSPFGAQVGLLATALTLITAYPDLHHL